MFHPCGQKTKYEPRFCQELINFLAQGYSIRAFAGHIEVNRDTLYEWMKQHDEFRDAKEIGLAKNLLYWEKQGIEGLWQEEKGPKLNTQLWMFNMKARHKWRETSDLELKVTTRELEKMSDDELDDILNRNE